MGASTRKVALPPGITLGVIGFGCTHGRGFSVPILLKLVVLCLTILCALAWGQEPQSGVSSFEEWKQQQVLEAQNQMLRISSHISQLKTGKPGTAGKDSSPANLPNSRIKKSTDSDTIASSERDLKRAQESLETANGLQVDDYISIYLPTLQDQPEALNKLAEKLSKEELAEIFKNSYKKGTHPSDARRNTVSSLTH